MKKKYYNSNVFSSNNLIPCLLFLSSLLLSFNSTCQTIEIGTGTSGSYTYSPVNRWYNYSASESVYTSAEIGTAGDINSIAWYKSSGSQSTTITGVTVYLKNSTTSSITTGTTSTSGYTQVYSGSLPNNFSSGWANLDLTSAFTYDGTSNLHVLVVKDYQAYTSSRPYYRYTFAATKYRKHSSDSYAWSSSTNMYGYNYRPNVRLIITGAPVTCTSEYMGPTISSFPHNTGFESTSYDWQQCLIDNMNWTRNTTSTPSSNTGPLSAPEGSYYMYTEASNGNANKEASLLCKYNLSALDYASMTFKYHMYGSTMGSLVVKANGTTLLTKTGQQHTYSGDPWSEATVDLSSYCGNSSVIIEILGTTGTNYYSDMAIDDITVDGGTGCYTSNAAINSFPELTTFASGLGTWQQCSVDDFDWTQQLSGTSSTGTGPQTSPYGANGTTGYAYTETSGVGNNKKASLVNKYDFTGMTTASMDFYYHMYASYGYGTGFILVYVNGTLVWSKSENYNGWQQASINLDAYAGQNNVLIEIRSQVTSSGTTYQCDNSVDEITIDADDVMPCSGSPLGGSVAISSAVGCPSTSVTLTATGLSSEAGITTQWQSSTTSSSTGFTDIAGVSGTSTTQSPSVLTYYRLQSTCVFNGATSTSTVASRTTAAATISSNGSNCGPGSISLTGSATGGSVQWYSAATGGSVLYTGNTFTTPNLSQTTTYYAASSGCAGTRTIAVASVNGVPTLDAGLGVTYCNGGSGNLAASASGLTPGTATCTDAHNYIYSSQVRGFYFTAPTSFKITSINVPTDASTSSADYSIIRLNNNTSLSSWYNVTNFTILGQGSNISGASATLSSPIQVNTGDVIGILAWRGIDNSYGSGSSTLTIDGVSVPVKRLECNKSGYDGNITNSDPVAGSASGNIGRINFSYEIGSPITSTVWSPGTGLSSAISLTPTASPTTSTQYTLTATDANGCQSTDVVDVTVNALPTINATPAANCGTGTVDLGATPSSGTTVNWYTSNSSTTSVGTGTTFTTPSLTSTTNYYAAATDANGCITNPREQITATINAVPNSVGGPDKTGTFTCGAQDVSLTGTNATNGATGTWTQLSGTNVLFADPNDATTTVTPQTYGGSATLRWTVTSGAGCSGTDDVVVEFNQPITISTISSPTPGDLVWGGMTNASWTTSANWYEYQNAGFWKKMTSGAPTSSSTVYIVPNSSAGQCVSSTYNAQPQSGSSVQDLKVMTGATVNLSNGTLDVSGNIVNNGTILPGSATVKFATNQNQTISGTGTSSFSKLTLDKTNGDLIISQPVTIENTLKMANGDIDNSALLTLKQATANALMYTSGHIKGQLRRYFPNSNNGGELLFPMKKGTMEREGKITFTQAPGPDQYLTVELKTGAPSMANNYAGLPFYASDAQLIQVYSNEGYLEIDPTAGNYSSSINSAEYTLKMHAKNMSGVNNSGTVRLIKSPGPSHTTWVPCGNHDNVSSTNVNDFWVTSITSTGFSFFGFGSNNDNPLPVELVSFNGNCGDGVVELNWTTASEHNSAYYQLEKSRDGETWNVINTQDAAGNSNEMRSYSFVDAHASAGNNLYRLSQFDIDGDSKTYSVVNVNCAAANIGYFSTHPNPSTGEFHVVLNNEELIGTATIKMVDSRGTIVSQKEIEVMEGINVYNFNEFKVAPGMYYITVVNDDKSTETIKQSIK